MLKNLQLKNNILSSFVVFLVAVPLCLGIALASGAPLFSGVITGAIGGIIVGALSGSNVSVSGPAAGMVTIVFAAIHQLGSFEAFLLALLLAGTIQILGGILRIGFIANYVPSTVIKGLLAAIGILIIIKQIPFALGYNAEDENIQTAVILAQESFSFSPILHVFTHLHPTAIIISLFSFFILIYWEKMNLTFLKNIPSAFVVVLLAIAMNYLFSYWGPNLQLNTTHLVNMPINNGLTSVLSQFKHPDFSSWQNVNVYFYALMIVMIASLETLLNLEAIEKIDKNHRYCSRDRELVAQGIGNIVSGLVGGLPITSVIVRSAVNLNAGGNNKISTIFHGLLLFLSLTFISKWLNYIPISALASILIYTGYKLANISIFKEVYYYGKRYFIPFIITIVGIITTNLLLGIIIGLFGSFFFILYQSSKNEFVKIDEKHAYGDVLRLILPEQTTFLNRAAIIESLNKLPKNSKVIIDATMTDYIELEIIEVLKEFKDSLAKEKNILINLEGFQERYEMVGTKSFLNVTTYDIQAKITPETVLTILREGNNRFINNQSIHKNLKQQISATSSEQHPVAVVISCIDSRVPIEIIFDLNLGDVFVIRIAGNIINEDILASAEYACHIVGAKLIVVLGHKNCGAIKAACEDVKLGHIAELIKKIKPAILQTQKDNTVTAQNSETYWQAITLNNIQQSKMALYNQSAIIKNLVDSEQLGIIGAFYDVSSGTVRFDQTLNEKLSLSY